MRPRILQFAGDLDRLPLPVASSVTLEQGDLLSYESNTIVLMDLVTEDATFMGYAINARLADNTQPDRMVCGLKGLVTYDVTSAAYVAGQGLMYTSKNCLVDHGSSAANTIAWSAQETSSASVTRLDVAIDVLAVRKIFETVAA